MGQEALIRRLDESVRALGFSSTLPSLARLISCLGYVLKLCQGGFFGHCDRRIGGS